VVHSTLCDWNLSKAVLYIAPTRMSDKYQILNKEDRQVGMIVTLDLRPGDVVFRECMTAMFFPATSKSI
jgi:hypothetical protein